MQPLIDHALFVPALITGARPCRLFELRSAGDIVPPYGAGPSSGEAATSEYAVEVLGVSEIVVCGHSHCGAVGALVRGDDLTAGPAGPAGPAVLPGPAVRDWPAHAAGGLRIHGWYHEFHTGPMRAHRPGTDPFETL